MVAPIPTNKTVSGAKILTLLSSKACWLMSFFGEETMQPMDRDDPVFYSLMDRDDPLFYVIDGS